VSELQDEMARKSVVCDTEKLTLEKACVDVYEDGFFKAVKQALTLTPEIDPFRFDIDKMMINPRKTQLLPPLLDLF